MKQEYEQMELDTRSELEKAISGITADTISDALELIEKNCENSYDNLMPRTVRNRYEAYGVAAEQMVNISAAVKAIKGDVQKLLDALSNPNISAIEAASSIVNGMVIATEKLTTAAAVMKRTMNHLYEAEKQTDGFTPFDEWETANKQDYQESEPLTADGHEYEEPVENDDMEE